MPAARITETVLAVLPKETHPELQRFIHILRDYPTRAGKAFRGRLVLLAAETFGASETSAALSVAGAIELLQNWALIHDDIADESDTRRGRPSLHHLVGLPVALNAGDALHGLMWQLLLEAPDLPMRNEILQEFTRITYTTAAGQHLDLVWAERPEFAITEGEYLEVVKRKTAYYTVIGPLRLGAFVAGTEPPAELHAAGEALGIAFQLHDDLLDLASEEVTGKAVGGDLYESKRTLLLGYALQHISAADRQRAEHILAKPRTEKTADEIAELIAFIEHSGAAAYTAKLANEYQERGLHLLAQALAHVPEERRERLLTMLTQVTSRAY